MAAERVPEGSIPAWAHGRARLYAGDCRAVLAALPAASVHVCVTSPPYLGLRAYGTAPQVWGGDPACAHDWATGIRRGQSGGTASPMAWNKGENFQAVPDSEHATCARCGCWRGELGAEPEVGMYVAHLVEVFRAVRRVLRPDGTCWVAIGDSYASGEVGRHDGVAGRSIDGRPLSRKFAAREHRARPAGPPAKNLLLVPQRLALALQADGWIVRSVIRWCKAAPMPESVKDRPTSAVEEVLVLAKRADYYWDAEAVAEPTAEATAERARYGYRHAFASQFRGRPTDGRYPDGKVLGPVAFAAATRNMRNYWLIPPEPLDAPHFAPFPSAIPTRAILAATSEAGCCPACGAPRRRVVERVATASPASARGSSFLAGKTGVTQGPSVGRGPRYERGGTAGWVPTCRCPASEPAPATVLDPFAGSGTTGLAALRLGRSFVGVELNGAYVELAKARLAGAASQMGFADLAAIGGPDQAPPAVPEG